MRSLSYLVVEGHIVHEDCDKHRFQKMEGAVKRPVHQPFRVRVQLVRIDSDERLPAGIGDGDNLRYEFGQRVRASEPHETEELERNKSTMVKSGVNTRENKKLCKRYKHCTHIWRRKSRRLCDRESEAYRNDENYEKILFLHPRSFLELLQRRDFVRNEFYLFQRRLYVFREIGRRRLRPVGHLFPEGLRLRVL